VGPFCADANLKYEIYISNNYEEKIKRGAPMAVQLCHTSIGATPDGNIFCLVFVS
jgi:hypothetical protein